MFILANSYPLKKHSAQWVITLCLYGFAAFAQTKPDSLTVANSAEHSGAPISESGYFEDGPPKFSPKLLPR